MYLRTGHERNNAFEPVKADVDSAVVDAPASEREDLHRWERRTCCSRDVKHKPEEDKIEM